jgi:hypothetical protein
LHDRDDHHLCDPFAGIDGKRLTPAVPTRHHELALVVGVDESHQVAQHHTVFVTEARAGQYHGRQSRVIDVNGEPGRNELGLARLEHERRVQAGTQIQPGGAPGGIRRQREVGADARVQNPHLQRAALDV